MSGESSVQMRNQSKNNRSEVQNTINYIIKRLVPNKRDYNNKPNAYQTHTIHSHDAQKYFVKLLVCKYKVLV